MARINSYEDLSAWIDKQKTFIDGCRYGKNRQSLLDGLDEQRKWSTEVIDMESKVTQILNRTYDAEKKKRLLDAYEGLKAVVEKKIHCLETMLEVASLEENCTRLSRDFDVRSVDLVKSEISRMSDFASPGKSTSSTESLSSVDGKNLQGFIATTAQDCINGLRNNWDWVAKLVKCIDIHLKNSSDYHQFYHEVHESEPWMLADFSRFSKAFDNQPSKTEKEDASKLAADLDSIYVSLRQWEAKTNRLLNTASRLVPVPLRTDGTTEPTPATALCDYETKDISFSYGEDLLLLDNSNPNSWKVRNGKNEESEVPPVIILIPGPSKEAIDIATKLQLQLLTAWTNALKRIGVRLICHMLTVFKPQYKPQEIAALTSMEDIDKDHLLQLLNHIEDTLRKHWSDQEGFVSLQERLLALRMTLEEVGDGEGKDPDLYKSLIIEITALGQLMNIYQDMFKDWEKFKVAIESSRAPDLMLIVDKWEQLQFVSRDYFSKFWKLKLPLDERERSVMRARNFTLDGVQFEDTIDLLSPRPDSARLSLASTEDGSGGGLHRTTATVVRRLNLEDQRTGNHHHDDVFNEEKTKSVVTSSVIESSRKWVTVDDVTAKDPECNGRGGGGSGKEAEATIQKMLGKDSGDGWNEEGFDETKIKTMTTKILGNAHQVKNVVKASTSSSPDWNKEDGFDETRTVTTTTKNLRYGTQTEAGFGTVSTAAEELVEGSSEDGFSETRTRTVITDGVTFARAAVDSDGKGGKRESPARAVRRLQSSQSSFPEVEEAGFEELRELDFTHHNRLSSSEYEGAQFGIASETKTAETEQLSSAEMEEKKTFVIKSVINPNDQTDISLQQAIMLGVIRPNDGVYVDSQSGHSVPIATAMSDGLIRVMFSTTKRTPEKFSSIGIITVKTIRKLARPCVIVSVRDSTTKEDLSVEEAHHRGILDEHQGSYTDRSTGRKLMIAEAVEQGLMVIEFCGDQPEAEVISKTYAVRAVVDRRLKKTITFHEAVRRGIIDKESGAFKDTITNEKMYVGDAIMRGFLKARVIEDGHGLNIDPENKMIIDKTQKIRERLLKPLKVISAFKMAARDGLKK